MIALGMPFPEVKEIGHWISDSSLRIYIDMVQASQIQVDLKAKGLYATFAYSMIHIKQWFPAEWLKAC